MTAQEEISELEKRIAGLERQFDQLKAASETTVLDRAQLEYEEVAAICFAAGLNLERNLGNVEEALDRYRYAVEHFPETAAAQKAWERIEKLTNNAV